MMKKTSFLVVWALLFNLEIILCTKYKLFVEHPDVVIPCAKHPDHYYDKVVDFSKINRTVLSNGNIYIKGDLTVIKDLGGVPLTLNVHVYKKIRGVWVNTIYNMERPDFCKALNDPNEFYHNVVKSLKVEGLCPLRKDLVISWDTEMDLTFNIATPSMEGIYRAEIYMMHKKDFYCAEALLQVVMTK